MDRYLTLLKRSARSFGSDKCAMLAAAIAYYAVFALFPLALVGVSALGFVVGDSSARDNVIESITSVIPLGAEGERALNKALSGVHQSSGWLGLIGLLTSMWSASSLFGVIRSALDSLWDVDRPLPLLRAKLRDLMLMSGFGGLILASTAATGVLQAARQVGSDWLGPLAESAAPVFAVLVFAAPILLTFAAFMVLYRFGAHARLGWTDVWPAAVLAALFFEFGKNLLAYYIRNLGNFNALAGPLGVAILFLVFVYYAGQVILFAAEIAKHRSLVRAGTLPATDPKPQRGPLREKLAGSLSRLWNTGEPHHDAELPYQPGRLGPATNRPMNTREEVLLDQPEALGCAARDSHNGGEPPIAPHPWPANTSFNAVLVRICEPGTAQARLAAQWGDRVVPLLFAPDARITRDAKPAKAGDLHSGDHALVRVDGAGHVRRLEALRPRDAGFNWWQAAATTASLTGTVVDTLKRLRRHSPTTHTAH